MFIHKPSYVSYVYAAEARQQLGPGAVIHCREALLDSPAELPAADVVVGNPPYQRSIHMSRTDAQLWNELRGKLAATSFGEWDLYAAFLERALDWICAVGHIGLMDAFRFKSFWKQFLSLLNSGIQFWLE